MPSGLLQGFSRARLNKRRRKISKHKGSKMKLYNFYISPLNMEPPLTDFEMKRKTLNNSRTLNHLSKLSGKPRNMNTLWSHLDMLKVLGQILIQIKVRVCM
jgi:hypothetical protein